MQNEISNFAENLTFKIKINATRPNYLRFNSRRKRKTN